MYNNEPIDEYIRSILGYPVNSSPQNMCNCNMPFNSMDFSTGMPITSNMTSMIGNEDLEECYPEIYKIVYPMVVQRCTRITEPHTSDLVDRITDEIYSALESSNNEIVLNINLQNEMPEERNVELSTNSSVQNSVTMQEAEKENRSESRQIVRNPGLNDLIRVLIIRELLGRPGGRPPIFRPGRPPFPGGPGGNPPPFPGGNRPPIRPRGYLDYDLYEQN